MCWKSDGLLHMRVQCFDQMIWIVHCLHLLFILIECFHRDVAILGLEVDDQLPCGHSGILGDSMILGAGVHVANGADEELFQ